MEAWHTVGDDDMFAVDVVRALSGLGANEAFNTFAAALQHRDERVRQLAVMGLGRLRDPAAGPKLIRALSDDHGGVRRIAAHALGLLADPIAIRPLLESIVGENPEVRAAVALALAQLDRSMVLEMLTQSRQSDQPELRAASCYVAGRIDFVDGLENAVVDPDVRVRKAACLAIGNCRDLRYREVLEATLADLEWPVRVAAAEGLKRLGDPAARPALMRCAEDPHKVVRNAIRVALGALETA
jgi:HEAT repeat protein